MNVDGEGHTMALADVRLQAGQIFAARYEVLGILGEGGMGAVYRVRDTEIDEEVALKVLRPEIAGSRDAVERFRREVKLARKVTHPNVARTYDLGNAAGTRFLTMELIAGPALSARIAAGQRLSLADALRVAADVCRGLSAAHSVGVVHRDLKPDNVLLAGGAARGPLTGAERPVITDFGIARLSSEREVTDVGEGSRKLTVGVVVGTPEYMAPEQVLGQDPDGRADVYALGVMLFELLTGRTPFQGQTAYAIAAARLTAQVPDIREFDAQIPDGIAALISAAMGTRREDRPDAARMLGALEQLLGVGGQMPDVLGSGSGGTLASTTMVGEMSPSRPRSLAVLPITSTDAEGALHARDLSAALADALSRLRALRVVPPAVAIAEMPAHPLVEGGVDLPAVARALRADRVLTGTLRAAGDKLRVNLRLIDPAGGAQLWGERFDGDRTDAFALEDALVRGALDALRGQLGGESGATAAGPSDPAVRALYDKAREFYHSFGNPEATAEGVALLRRALALAPLDASVMTMLGALLVRQALGRDDTALMAEAEDLALRALDADPSLGETYATLGLVRLHQGQFRAAVRAFREALARNPRHAEAASYIGRFLAESGNADDGIRRIEFALRLEPRIQRAWWDLARVHALRGDLERYRQAIDRCAAANGGPQSTVTARARVALWFMDVDEARAIAEDASKMHDRHPVRRGYATLVARVAAGEPIRLEDDMFFPAAPSLASPANRAFMYQVSTEVRCIAGEPELALEPLERAVALPFADLLWMDLCPAIASLRPLPRFARARAAVAARAQEIWT